MLKLTFMNRPYVKAFSKTGELLNPITKSKPYLHSSPNRFDRNSKTNYLDSEYMSFTVGRKTMVLKRYGNNRKKVNSRGRKSRIINLN